ncbi:MAG: hypothetical protein DI551_04030 [Micavibrio aeruginosavorus]|uniref:Haemolysin-type calcium binding-related domain-containing protein n=1 Tax=Micavibrio aeruginosavorus TaxID=349221 RepID=A0A2W5N1V0_9BACT|nr:MAG: hypothetical protein DI551_04030 [Micavibrio aeruginosavorus]
MAYTIVTGTSGNNFMNFVGVTGFYSQTLVNPYSGYTITITGTKNVNNAIYDGLGGNSDRLTMTTQGDVLTLSDASGTLMVKNVEIFVSGDDGDVIILADSFYNYGNTSISGGNGDDLLWANNGNDTVFGNGGDDIMDGGGGNDILFGGEGNDYLDGGAGIDSLFAGAGDDTLVFNVDGIWSGGLTLADLGSAVPFASLVNLDGKNQSYDTFNGDATDNIAVPTIGTDTLLMTSGADVLVISDSVSPNSGLFTPRISYIEIYDAGDGDDIVDLSGADHIATTIHGGDGNDVLAGSIGDDTITGDAGNDILFGAGGNDLLEGGTGDDAYYYNLGNGNDTIRETSGNDSLHFGPGVVLDDLTFTVEGDNLVVGIGGQTITIENHYATDHSGRVESIVFDDGSSFDVGSYVPNYDPVANNDAFNGNEDEILSGNVLANDTDANGDVLSVAAQTIITANGGTVVMQSDGSFTYQGAQDFNGEDSFDYTVSDNKGGLSTASVILGIAAINDAPIAQADIFAVFRNDTLSGNVLSNDSDVDGDAMTVQAGVFASAEGGMVTLGLDGSLSYTPAEGFYGQDSFEYTLTDGQAFAFATVTLTVELNPEESIIGTSAPEVILGTVADDEIFALGGDDEVKGGDGDDTLYGGDGDDVLYGDDSILTVTYDKRFSDSVAFPNLQEGVSITRITPRGDAALGIANGNLSVDMAATVTITFRAGYAGYDSSFGMFGIAPDGTIVHASLEWANVKTAGLNIGYDLELPVGAQGGAFGFFIIANGNNANGHYNGLDITADGVISFIYKYGTADERAAKITDNGNDVSVVYDDGAIERVLHGYTYLSTDRGNDTTAINPDGMLHVVSGLVDPDNTNTLRVGFEDLYGQGDADFEDVLFDIDIKPVTVTNALGGNDYLDGGAGNDTLFGEGGSDILIIGNGADHAYGGAGADVFAITMIDDLIDTIHDFSALQGDVINITDVLESYDALHDDISHFVRIVQNGNDAELQINADGDAGGAFTTAAIILGGTYGATAASLLASGALVADHSVALA